MADLPLMYKTWKSWIGQRVSVKNAFGTLKYFGKIKFKDGLWCGVELDEPVGENDGMIHNVQYFKCKANYGIFVPVSETTKIKRPSSEVNPVRDLIKFKYAGCGEDLPSAEGLSATFSQNLSSSKLKVGEKILKKVKSRNSSDLNKTFQKNELKNNVDTFCFKVPKENLHIGYIADKKYENVSKRSKNTCGRLETEESLGILSNLLDEEESWNLLDLSATNRIGNKCLIQKSSDDIDSVFYPSAEISLLDSQPNFYVEQVDSSIKKVLNSKCTSTPKRVCSNLFDLNRTVKLNDKQSYDFLHDEPIVAGSSMAFETDFDLAKFKPSDILCSTLKCSLPLLSTQSSASDEICCMNNDQAKSNNNDTTEYQEEKKSSEENDSRIFTVSKVCVNPKQLENIRKGCTAENSDVLNTTFVINLDSLSSPAASTSVVIKNNSPYEELESNNFQSDRKPNCQMDSTFATCNLTEKVLEGEQTFIIDCSPKKIPNALPLDCQTITKNKVLSPIFETANCENGTAESEDGQTNATGNESLIFSKLSTEDMDQVMKSSLSKIVTSNLNSTFNISSNESMNKKNIASLDVKKRYSLSSISMKNNVCIKKEKSVMTKLQTNGKKSVIQSRLSVVTKKKSLQSSTSTNSISSLKQFKDIKLRDNNATEVSSAKKFLEMRPKGRLKKTCSATVESSSDIAYARQQLKKSLEPCKSVDNFSIKQENQNESYTVLKINENNSKVVEQCKDVSNLQNKVIPKMPSNYKQITFEYSNFNRKVKELTGSHKCNSKNIDVQLRNVKHRHSMLPTFTNSENSNFNLKVKTLASSHDINSKNPIDVKAGNVKHRHSMLPSVLAKSTRTKNSSVVKSSFAFTESESVPPSKTQQDGFRNERGTEREYTKKKSVPAERVSENHIKYAKKNENSTTFKSKLLKPGTLSRLPVPGKLSEKSSCILVAVDSESQHSIKSIGKIESQSMYRRSPLQKLQDKH